MSLFNVNDVEEKYYLSEKVEKYVLANGTKNFKTNNNFTDLGLQDLFYRQCTNT